MKTREGFFRVRCFRSPDFAPFGGRLEGSQTSPRRQNSGRLRRAGRFGSYPPDLALFFSARVWPQISLNSRLPRTTQRVFCLLVREINYSNRPRDKTSRWAIRGSRLFNSISGLHRTGKNRRDRWARAKAAPLRSPTERRAVGYEKRKTPMRPS